MTRVLTREEVGALAADPESATLLVSPELLADLMGCAVVRPDGEVLRLIAVTKNDGGWLDATFRTTGERGVIGHGEPKDAV